MARSETAEITSTLLVVDWAASDGMRRFGLPELRAGGAERDLREELKEILFGAAFRLWSDLIGRAQATPGAGRSIARPGTTSSP